MPIELIPIGESTRMPDDKCSYCGELFNAATAAHCNPESLPEPGSVSICVRCGELHIFGADFHLRRPTDEELAELKQNEEFWDELVRYRENLKRAVGVFVITNNDDFTRRKQ
jgi:hypothetical protein